MQSGIQILERTDDQGQLRMAGLHDAELTQLSYTSRAFLQFSLRGQSGETSEFVIRNPVIMNIGSLWEGSIVDAVFAWKLESMPDQLWVDPENGWNAILDQRVDKADRRREADRITKLHPAYVLVAVSCSYGGRWAVVGEDASVCQKVSLA